MDSSRPETRDSGSSLIPNIEDAPFTCSTNPINSLCRSSCSMNYGLGVACDDLSDVLGVLWDVPLDPKSPCFGFNKVVLEGKAESNGAKRTTEEPQSPQSHSPVCCTELSGRPSGKRARRKRSAESHNMSERRRRDRIRRKMATLQHLIPNCNKTDKVSMLEDAIEYIKALKSQVQMMRMHRSSVCQVPNMQPSAPIWPVMGVNMHMHMQPPMGMMGMSQTSPNMFSSPSAYCALPLLHAFGPHCIPNMQLEPLSIPMSPPVISTAPQFMPSFGLQPNMPMTDENSAAFQDLNNAAQLDLGEGGWPRKK